MPYIKLKYLVVLVVGLVFVWQNDAHSRSKQEIEKEYSAHSMRAVPRDAFPVLTDPPLGPIADGDKLIHSNDWVIGIAINGDARAYPITVMGIHELINDTIGGQPITVCW